jgi:hypothetical protein
MRPEWHKRSLPQVEFSLKKQSGKRADFGASAGYLNSFHTPFITSPMAKLI